MKKKILLLILFSLFQFSCKELPIVHDLTERDANEIVVLLARNNIPATKIKEVKNQEVVWSITVSESDDMQARSILVSNNLPRIRHGGLEGICKDAGLILTPKTEKCREILAYKGEIINSLESIPGVVSADAVLNVPDKEEFPDENMPVPRPTASITIQYLKDANIQTRLTEGKVQEFVANTISGLDARDVTVIISFLEQKMYKTAEGDMNNIEGAKTPETITKIDTGEKSELDEADETPMVSIGGIVMDEASAKKFKLIAGVFLGMLLLLAGAFIFALLRMSKMRKQSSVPAIAAIQRVVRAKRSF